MSECLSSLREEQTEDARHILDTVRLDRTTLSLVGIDSIMLPSEGDSTVLSGRNITFDPSHRHIRLGHHLT